LWSVLEFDNSGMSQLHQVFITMQLDGELRSKVPPIMRSVQSEIGSVCKQLFHELQPTVSQLQVNQPPQRVYAWLCYRGCLTLEMWGLAGGSHNSGAEYGAFAERRGCG
jgi:hypothetical protein